ncbi:MAG: cobalamin biosynthesis protein, partial [Sulfuritalea sp.]|nr:cobalamin biosynthesis protein [Sulfuritalea sp.]
MTFLSLLCVLILEQIRAVPAARLLAAQSAYADYLEGRLNGGEARHGMIAWVVGVAVPALLALLLHFALARVHVLLAFGFNVLMLYFLLGFRQFSHFFTDIQLALRMGELERARQLLAQWRGKSGDRLGSAEVARLAIEQGIVASHRHVFAPLFWFLALGPAGALLYRLALVVAEGWRGAGGPAEANPRFDAFACRAFHW